MTGGIIRIAGRGYSYRTFAIACVSAAALIGIGLVLGLAIGRGGEGVPAGEGLAGADEAGVEMWTCAMHPQIRQPRPGQCPICAMDLVPVTGGGGDDLGPRDLRLSDAARKLAEIQTAPVERRAVVTEVRLAGKVEYDETRVSHITAWVPGRLERLYVDYTGVTVKRGDRMVSLYSPELLAAQEELIQSLRAVRDLSQSDVASLKRTAARTVEAAREKLGLWGLTPGQIAEIESRGTAADKVDILAPAGGVVVDKNALQGQYVSTGTRIYTIADLSVVWVKLDAYESDLVWMRAGQHVEFAAEAFPGQEFEGEVVFVDPVLNPDTRTAKVRVNLDNPGGRLKPGMFVRAVVTAGIGAGSDGRAPLVIPATAPLLTGERAVVYVETEPGLYHGAEVVLGPRAGDYYIVEQGLEEGQRVVTRGNFKIDSAIQIMAGPSMMNPEGGGPAPGHDHGAHGRPEADGMEGAAGSRTWQRYHAPPEFRRQLDEVYQAYLHVHRGLSQDDLDEGKAGARMLLEALAGVDMKLVGEPAHSAWMKTLADLEKSSRAVSSAGDIAKAREAFSPLSEAAYAAARQFGTGGRMPLNRFHCSMAFDDRGAYWMQSNEEVENPYWGSVMYRCGEMTETVADGAEGGAGEHRHE
jgi:Cu(I)/Ag(I) efflux system membrane fusion protein